MHVHLENKLQNERLYTECSVNVLAFVLYYEQTNFLERSSLCASYSYSSVGHGNVVIGGISVQWFAGLLTSACPNELVTAAKRQLSNRPFL